MIKLSHRSRILGILEAPNSCVFEGALPSIHTLLQIIGDECSLWCMARASKLSELLTRGLWSSLPNF